MAGCLEHKNLSKPIVNKQKMSGVFEKLADYVVFISNVPFSSFPCQNHQYWQLYPSRFSFYSGFEVGVLGTGFNLINRD